MSSHDIPFFNDIPTKAITPVTRLWDASRNPAYNGLKAYSDFVTDCNDRGIAPPPRAVVKRFIAGVQCGQIARPGETDAPAKPSVVASAKAYFDNLPDAAGSAVQAAWDRANDDQFPRRGSFDMFCRDMNELGHAAPTRGEYDAWWTAVRKGEVERPERQIVEEPNSAAEVTVSEAAVQADDASVAEAVMSSDAATEPSTLSYERRNVHRGLLKVKGNFYGHADLAPYEGKLVLVGFHDSAAMLIEEIVVREADDHGVPGKLICLASIHRLNPYQPVEKAAAERAHRKQTSISCGIDDIAGAGFIPLTPADFSASRFPVSSVLVTHLTEIEEGISAHLRNDTEAMINEAEEKLRAGLRRQAERLVAAQLRAMAEELSTRAA